MHNFIGAATRWLRGAIPLSGENKTALRTWGCVVSLTKEIAFEVVPRTLRKTSVVDPTRRHGARRLGDMYKRKIHRWSERRNGERDNRTSRSCLYTRWIRNMFKDYLSRKGRPPTKCLIPVHAQLLSRTTCRSCCGYKRCANHKFMLQVPNVFIIHNGSAGEENEFCTLLVQLSLNSASSLKVCECHRKCAFYKLKTAASAKMTTVNIGACTELAAPWNSWAKVSLPL